MQVTEEEQLKLEASTKIDSPTICDRCGYGGEVHRSDALKRDLCLRCFLDLYPLVLKRTLRKI